MARIRSIHPGLFTDDAYMSLSFAARELVKGIWCEADDGGVFEWKPLTLKARLMPADSVNMDELLGELVTHRFITQFAQGDKSYGAVRNFRKYQRPKKPTYSHPLPDELRTYVGLTDESSEPVPHQSPTKEEKSPQREEGGGREGEGKKERGETRAPAQRGTRLSPEWTPSLENIAFCRKEGLTDDDAAHIGRRFKNHWLAKPGKDAVKLNWDRTWENWVLRDIEDGRVGNNGPGKERRGPVGDVALAAEWAARNQH